MPMLIDVAQLAGIVIEGPLYGTPTTSSSELLPGLTCLRLLGTFPQCCTRFITSLPTGILRRVFLSVPYIRL